MPLFNLRENREKQVLPRVNKSDYVHLRHNRGIQVEEEGNVNQLWKPVTRVYQGFITCINNPPFPEATIGQMYAIIDDGTIGGFSVKKGDAIECISETSEEGYGDDIKNNWLIYSKTEGGGGSIIPSEKNSVKYISFDITNHYESDVFSINTIIKRIIIQTTVKYPENSKLVLTSGKFSTTIDLGSEKTIIDTFIGYKMSGLNNIICDIPNYSAGKAFVIIELYSDSELDGIKNIQINMHNSSISDEYFIPENSIITNIMVLNSLYQGEFSVISNSQEIFNEYIKESTSFVLLSKINSDSKIQIELGDSDNTKIDLVAIIEYI